jgi:hypothetical protein
MTTRIFICGSCVSRDAFTLDQNDRFTLVDYFARSSFASSFSLPAAQDAYSEQITSAFQRRQISRDFHKTLPGALREAAFDLLLIDFIDERFPLFRFNDGSIVTISAELHLLRVLTPDLGTRFDPFDDRQFTLWCAGLERLVAQCRATGRMQKIMINKVCWSSTTLDGSPDATPPAQIAQANTYLERQYAHCARLIPAAQFITYDPDLLRSDPDHRWGLAPYHYGPAFYDSTLEQLICRAAQLMSASAGDAGPRTAAGPLRRS